ncbi:MAG TPA: transcription-repair coupling factor [Syntrophales bacterium]|nr:transcription-repair coupling factor [Syntrophales bacterium]
MQQTGEKSISGGPSLDHLFDLVSRGERKVGIGGLQQSAKSFLLSLLFRKITKSLAVICPTEKDARVFCQDLSFFLGEDQVFLYPPSDVHSTDIFAFQKDAALLRMEILCRLLRQKPAILVVPLKALMGKVLPVKALMDYLETISLGDRRELDELAAKLLSGGYSRVSLVEEKGEFSVRGNIIDIFPPTEENPMRLEFMGDELESIRTFDPLTQRSIREICDFPLFPSGEIILTPDRRQLAVTNVRRRANELELSGLVKNRIAESVANGLVQTVNPLFISLFYESIGNGSKEASESPGIFLDYLSHDSLLVFDDPLALRQTEQAIENEIDGFLLKAKREGIFYLEKESSYLVGERLFERFEDFTQIYIGGINLSGGETEAPFPHVNLSTEKNIIPKGIGKATAASDAGNAGFLVEYIKRRLEDGSSVVFLCVGPEEAQRMAHLFAQHDLRASQDLSPQCFFAEPARRLGKESLVLLNGRLSAGFHFPLLNLVVITEEEIFGRKITRKKTRPTREGYFLQSFGELNEGNYVVHADHGIGLYRGLQKLVVEGLENDFLLLEYQGGDKLYLPVYRLDLLQRYIGPADYAPPVDKLGGGSWDTVKERVKKSLREVAEELAAIYATRQVMEGHSFSLPAGLYDEFCSGFEFEETPDQAKAIEDVELDMAEAKPMDRLICGDAGFGKTEVALRASFITAMEGKQAAVLVPTTILAEQHYQTFSRRLKDWPLRVEVMNRFKTKVQQQGIAEGIRQGTVDIVIGTHRLLQKDIAFKDLGLVVIDEEQRFGVAHKEKLKKLRTLVDVLTLTATPIPRTLHLAMVGIRDLTVINTPPEDRLPIKTYLVEFDEDLIKEAIRKELARGGQIFFLHDRVRSIYSMARFVEKIVPEARIGVVHGRMKAKEIEDTMAGFVRGENDVLVCTTIIGAGLDIPTANTIIINRADRFGLSQLYQIKGRVGRAKEEGKAYLLIPKGMMLSRDAGRRLQAITDISEHGSGFRISYHDLELRGGGNILGTSQSGHISAVGYELYTELMEQTLREIRGEEVQKEETKPEIHLGVAAFIPEEYMTDVRRRLSTYKRLSMAETDDELALIREELTDCYGFVPSEVENLLDVLGIKNLLYRLRGKKMGYDKKNMVITFHRESNVDPAMIVKLAREKWPGIRLTPDFQLYVPMPDLKKGEILREARGLLRALS